MPSFIKTSCKACGRPLENTFSNQKSSDFLVEPCLNCVEKQVSKLLSSWKEERVWLTDPRNDWVTMWRNEWSTDEKKRNKTAKSMVLKPMYRQRVEKPKKGKGSYSRKEGKNVYV